MDPGMLQDISVFYTCAPDFNSDALEAAEIWKIQADGSLRQKLFVTEAVRGDWITWLSSLQLSRNGQMMTFIQFFTTREIMADAGSLWVVNVDGSRPRELVSKYDLIPGSATWSAEDDVAFWRKPRPISPIWAPDSSRLAFVDALSIGANEPGAVCILDVESGNWRAWGEGEVFDWSPDGSELAIHSASRYAVTNDLQVADIEGNTESVIALPPSTYLLSLDWSVSTGSIVAQSRDLETPDLLVSVIDPRDSSHRVVIEDRHVSYPQWSPNGKMISFVRSAGDTHGLYILDLDSGDMRMIMSQVHPPIVWSPDGHLVLVRSEVKGNGLYIVSVSGGQYWKIPALEDDEQMCFGSYTWLFPPQ
jgi:Tol biopolymer transport system component